MLRHARVLRFLIVGIVNAAISFGILNLVFYVFHESKITSSIIATTCALIFSFWMNRSFVFADKSKRAHQQLPIFIIVTISGSLLVLNLVYVISLKLLSDHESWMIHLIKDITSLSLSKNFIDINLSMIIGAAVAMVWNYNGYKWFVFKGDKSNATKEPYRTA